MFGFGKQRKLKNKQVRVAILVADGIEQAQLDESIKALRKARAETFILSTRPGKIQALKALKPGAKVPVDATLDEVHPASFAALVIPGGTISADKLRVDLRALEFIRSFDRTRKPIAAIGHATWILASAGVLRGRRLTGWPGSQDDIANAGGEWVDEPVVVDGNLLTSRTTKDIGKFTKRLVKHFAQQAEDSTGTLIEAEAGA